MTRDSRRRVAAGARRRPSAAMVVALLALFIALGGTGYATLALPASSVGSKQLKRNAVTNGALAADAVTSAKVKNHSLLAKDFAVGQLPRGARGAQGVKGDRGLTGTPGRDGAAVAARIRSTAEATTPADHSTLNLTIAPTAWTQAPGEVDLLPYGELTVTDPSPGSCGGTGLADLNISVNVDGTSVSTSLATLPLDGALRTRKLPNTGYLYEHATATPHTVSVALFSTCESGSFPVPITVHSLGFDVIRAS